MTGFDREPLRTRGRLQNENAKWDQDHGRAAFPRIAIKIRKTSSLGAELEPGVFADQIDYFPVWSVLVAIRRNGPTIFQSES